MTKQTASHRVTYLGTPYEIYAIQTGGPTSLRIAVRHNLQTGVTTAKVIEGDGRTLAFREILPEHEVTPAQLAELRRQLDAGTWS